MKNKYQLAAKKRWENPEYRKKISEAHSHELPKEWRENMSEAKKGIRPKNYEEMRKNAGFENANYKGRKHWNWKGGITPEKKRLRSIAKYQIWRNAVFLRDDFTCQRCGIGRYLEAHHKKSVRDYPELIFKIDNGMTLCPPCHTEVDKHRFAIKQKDKIL
ncbi:MAG: HNH endonuclease [Patescibacteria group bacterium]|nr:HNH endonuclease [Patescibacteria group bacterium]